MTVINTTIINDGNVYELPLEINTTPRVEAKEHPEAIRHNLYGFRKTSCRNAFWLKSLEGRNSIFK